MFLARYGVRGYRALMRPAEPALAIEGMLAPDQVRGHSTDWVL
jgi:hypothetical protein